MDLDLIPELSAIRKLGRSLVSFPSGLLLLIRPKTGALPPIHLFAKVAEAFRGIKCRHCGRPVRVPELVAKREASYNAPR